MKANLLLKQNIDALLRRRGHTRRELAMWVLRTTEKNRADSWIGHIFGPKGHATREIQMKYLDRVADFFGIAVYQLLQPGISPLTERRKGQDRRTGRDRRLVRSVLVSGPTDADLLQRLRLLTTDERVKLDHWIDVLRLGRDDEQSTRGLGGQPAAMPAADPATPGTRKRRQVGG